MHGQYRLARLLPGGRTLEEYLSRGGVNTYSLQQRITELEIVQHICTQSKNIGRDDDFGIPSCKQFEVFAGRWRIRGIGGQLARHLSRSAAAIFAPNSTLLRFSPLVIFPTPQSLCYSTKSYAHCALHRDKIFTAPTMWCSVVIVSLDSAKLKGETSQKL